MTNIDPWGKETHFKVYSASVHFKVAGAGIGYANAKTDCADGKYYTARYSVIVTSIGIGISADVSLIIKLLQKSTSVINGSSFSIDDNYPPLYVPYNEIEGSALSGIVGLTFGDLDVGLYEGGRRPDYESPMKHAVSTSINGELGAQAFKISGVHLIRLSEPKEKCCGNKK